MIVTPAVQSQVVNCFSRGKGKFWKD
jgi:hypothetical protein